MEYAAQTKGYLLVRFHTAVARRKSWAELARNSSVTWYCCYSQSCKTAVGGAGARTTSLCITVLIVCLILLLSCRQILNAKRGRDIIYSRMRLNSTRNVAQHSLLAGTSTFVSGADLLVAVRTDTHERSDEVLAGVTTSVSWSQTFVNVCHTP